MYKYCEKCLYDTNHPLGLFVNKIECSGCETHKEKDQLDWENRRSELELELKKYKKNNSKYDCVVPVIGDAEDFYTLSKVMELGLVPLVVCVNDYFKNDIGWHNLHQLITYFDVDSFVFNPDIFTYKELIKTSLQKYNHILLPFLQLHTAFPTHIAYERKIPLVIWGQNQSVEQVGKFSHLDAIQMSRWSRREHDLFKTEIDELMGNGAQINSRNIAYYDYPSVSSLGKRGIKGLYLSNYFRWDPLKQNKSVTSYGFKPESNNCSFDIYERAGSSVYYNIHDILKFKRTGYRKITDHLVREIRHARVSKTEAKKIEDLYSSKPVNIKPFFDWLGVSKSGYDWFCKHRLHDVKQLICEDNNDTENITLPHDITKNINKSYKSRSKYILFDKGIDI